MLKMGKYEIVKLLARGGMAEIFLARAWEQPGFQRMVVVKRILPQLASNPEFLEMFLNEARIASTLQHPNIVQLFDVGVAGEDYFMAMEYLHGEDLRALQSAMQRLNERLPLPHALQIVIGVCAGLHHAHEKLGFDGRPLAIVHRDVSPQNVIVTFDGAVKLLDFGVAKAASNAHETRCGVVKGKIPYLSPEQCRGAPVDRRSDLFSVGILLYELTLGRRLFNEGTDYEILRRIAEQPVLPPRLVDRDYDEDLERIVIRALAKDPDRRYQTARALQVDLEELARRRGMYPSAIALQQFMARVFADRLLPAAEEYSVQIIVEKSPWRRRALMLAVCMLAALAGFTWHKARPRAAEAATPPPMVTPTLPETVAMPALPMPATMPATLPARAPIEIVAPRPRRHTAPPVEGTLVLDARPWCEVVVDGTPRGATPSTVKLPPGRHDVRVSNSAFHIDSSFAVQIASQKVVRRSLSFPASE